MPRKTKATVSADKAAQPQFSAELLEQLLPNLYFYYWLAQEFEGDFKPFHSPVAS
jgi:putative transposase